jgi:hypothetical protein
MDKSNKTSNTERWEFLFDILVDPLFFAFAVSVLFTRLQAIINFTAANPTYSFWTALWVDVDMNAAWYIGFLIVFGVWAILKALKHRRDRDAEERLNNTLDGLKTAIEALPNKIAEAMKSSKDSDNKPKGI